MNKLAKALGITTALAVMIPLGAYAASSTTGSSSGDAKQQTIIHGKGEFRGGFGHKEAVSQEVLDLLKLDRKTLQEKLSSGKTLAQVAEEQGVSRDKLKQTLTDAFNKTLDEQKKQFASNLDNMVDGKLEKGGKFGFGMKQDLTEAAKLLGLTADELKTQLSSGKSLADIAKEKNVDVQKLIDAQKTAMISSIDQAVKDGNMTQEQADKLKADAANIAEKMVNGKGFKHIERGERGHKFERAEKQVEKQSTQTIQTQS